MFIENYQLPLKPEEWIQRSTVREKKYLLFKVEILLVKVKNPWRENGQTPPCIFFHLRNTDLRTRTKAFAKFI